MLPAKALLYQTTASYHVIHFVVSKVIINKTQMKYVNDIMCEIEHHLNDLHAKYCKHRFV